MARLLFGAKPPPKATLMDCQSDYWEQNPVKRESKYKIKYKMLWFPFKKIYLNVMSVKYRAFVQLRGASVEPVCRSHNVCHLLCTVSTHSCFSLCRESPPALRAKIFSGRFIQVSLCYEIVRTTPKGGLSWGWGGSTEYLYQIESYPSDEKKIKQTKFNQSHNLKDPWKLYYDITKNTCKCIVWGNLLKIVA